MRLWHQKLIPHLPDQQLLGQHRECCALRGNGWGKKHSTVDYVFEHPPEYLIAYHFSVMDEMLKRGMNPSEEWQDPCYRGKNCADYDKDELSGLTLLLNKAEKVVFPEHDTEYFIECVMNLIEKGAKPINVEKIDERFDS